MPTDRQRDRQVDLQLNDSSGPTGIDLFQSLAFLAFYHQYDLNLVCVFLLCFRDRRKKSLSLALTKTSNGTDRSMNPYLNADGTLIDMPDNHEGSKHSQ